MELRDRIKELRRVKARDLWANPSNWRKHPRSQIAALQGMLNELGIADVLLARELESGQLELIDGHARQSLDPDIEWPVVVLDLNEEEALKLLTTLDPLAGMAEVDGERLAALLETVRSQDTAVQGLLESLGRLAGGGPHPGAGLTDPDEAPEPPPLAKAVSELVDVWHLGQHRLLVGDATNAQDHEWLMAGKSAQLLITDPPYGVDYMGGSRLDHDREGLTMENDAMEPGDQGRFWTAAFAASRFEGDAYVFGPSGPNCVVLAAALGEAQVEVHQFLVWVKNQIVPGRSHYHYRHEHIMYGWRGRSSYQGSRKEASVWEADRPRISVEHPTMKPIALMERAIVNSSEPGGLVLDPFLGSGTSLLAAHRLNRVCFSMEIDPRYADVAVQRWEQHTGLKAVRERRA